MTPLFLSDVDGTLYQDGKIDPLDAAAVQKWLQAGHAFGLVTGRSASFCEDLAAQYGFSCQVLVCDNGARVMENGEVISEALLPADRVLSALRALMPFCGRLLPFVTWTDGHHYFPQKLYGQDAWRCLQTEQAHLTWFGQEDLETLLACHKAVPGISLYVRDEACIDSLLDEIRSLCPDLLWHKTSHDYIEASARDKADALKRLLPETAYGPVFFAGDGSNDIPVFDLLKNTYVMNRADESVKAHSLCCCESVAQAIERSFEYVEKTEKESGSHGRQSCD